MLTSAQVDKAVSGIKTDPETVYAIARAIESAVTAPLLERIATLEAESKKRLELVALGAEGCLQASQALAELQKRSVELEQAVRYESDLCTQAIESRDELAQVCAEAYQVVGNLLNDVGAFSTAEAEKVLDNLNQGKLVHKDVLPWPSFSKTAEIPEGCTVKDAQLLREANCSMAAELEQLKSKLPTKLAIPPPGADSMDVVFTEGWNQCCETYFGGLPPQPPLMITTTITPDLTKVTASFECEIPSGIEKHPTTTGSMTAKVKRAEVQDDGAVHVVIDYWPEPEDKFNCPSFAELGLTAPTPREYAKALQESWEKKHGKVVITTNPTTGECVAVTSQDSEGRILSVIWEKPTSPAQRVVGFHYSKRSPFGNVVWHIDYAVHPDALEWFPLVIGVK